MYAPPHLVKKCVVLCIRGLFCFVDPSLGPTSLMPLSGTLSRAPGVPKLFSMLLDKFHVGLWSSRTKLKLFPLLRHILPASIMKTLSFIFSREDCCDFKNYSMCYKMCDSLFKKPTSRVVCTENQILFVDVCLVSMRHNADAICYLPFPFFGSSIIRMRVELFLMLQLILYHSFFPYIGLPQLKIIWFMLLDLVRGISLLRNIFSVVATKVFVFSVCKYYCDDLL